MTMHVPLSPQLEQFVRDQLAAGHYRSEDEVVLAALRLLAQQSPSPGPGQGGEQPRTDPAASDVTAAARNGRRSPRGLLADLRSQLGPDEIADTRREMWSGFLHGGAS